MAGKKEGVDAARGALVALKQRAHGRRHQLVAGNDAEIGKPHAFRRHDRAGHDGRGGLEPHGGKDHRVAGMFGRQPYGVERRVDHLHAGPVGHGVLERTAVRPGHAQKIAEGGNDDVGPFRRPDEGRHLGIMGDAHRAARPGKMLESLGKQGTKAAAEYGHRVRAAHFHEAHGPAERLKFGAQPVEQGAAQRRIVKRGRNVHAASGRMCSSLG